MNSVLDREVSAHVDVLGRVDRPFTWTTATVSESIDFGSFGKLRTKPEIEQRWITCLASKVEEK